MIVYYDSTGKIVSAIAASSPDVVPPTNPGMALYLDDTEYAGLWNNGSPDIAEYTIQNGAPVYTPVPDATKLANAQQAKTAQLQASLMASLAGGFNSSATGTSYLYGFADMDQTNIAQELNIINAGLGTEPIAWAVKDGTVVNHTIPQFKQMCADGNRFKWNNVTQLRTLIGQVQSATTVDAVNAIQWTAATY